MNAEEAMKALLAGKEVRRGVYDSIKLLDGYCDWAAGHIYISRD